LHHLSGVRNYPEYKITEFKERVAQLQEEYRRFVAKCIALDPVQKLIGTPGNPHSYVSKKTLEKRKRELERPRWQTQKYLKRYSEDGYIEFIENEQAPLTMSPSEEYNTEQEECVERPTKKIKTIDTPLLLEEVPLKEEPSVDMCVHDYDSQASQNQPLYFDRVRIEEQAGNIDIAGFGLVADYNSDEDAVSKM